MSNVAGKYKASGNSPFGPQECIVDFTVDGDILTGTLELMGTVAEIEDGKVDGDNFTYKCTVKVPMGSFDFKVKGKVDGDKISGRMSHIIAKIDFEGERI